jgi:hypothetical protein
MLTKIISFFLSFFTKKETKKIFVNKDGVNKVIKESKLQEYLNKGYKRGRCKKTKK